MIAAAVLATLVCLAVSPYAARLTRTVPDRAEQRWYLGATPSRSTSILTAAVAVLLGLLAAAAARWSALLPAYVVFAVIAAVLIVVDAEHHRLPNRLLYPAGAAVLMLLALAAGVRGDWWPYLRAVEAGAVVYVVFLALALMSPKSLGMGDVRLAAVLALLLGFHSWLLVYVGLFAGFLLGAVTAVVLLAARRATRKTALPFGPALIVGALAVLAAAAGGALG